MAFNNDIEFEFILLNVDFNVEEFVNYQDNSLKTRIIINNPNNIIAYQTWSSSSSYINGEKRMVIPLNGYNFVKIVEIYNSSMSSNVKYNPTCVLRIGDEKYFITVDDFSHSGSSLLSGGSNNFKDTIGHSNGISIVCDNNFSDLNRNNNGKRTKKVPSGHNNGKFTFSPLKFKHLDHNGVLKKFLKESGVTFIEKDELRGKKHGIGDFKSIVINSMVSSPTPIDREKDFNFILEHDCDISHNIDADTTVITIKNPKVITYYEDWNEDANENNNYFKRALNKITAEELVHHVHKYNNNTSLGHKHATSLHKFTPSVYMEVSNGTTTKPHISVIKDMYISHKSLHEDSNQLEKETETILTIELFNNKFVDPTGNSLQKPEAVTNAKIYMNVDSASAGVELNDTFDTFYSVGLHRLASLAIAGNIDLNSMLGRSGLTELVDKLNQELQLEPIQSTGSNTVSQQKSLTPTKPYKKNTDPPKMFYTSLEKMLFDKPIDLVNNTESIAVKQDRDIPLVKEVLNKQEDIKLDDNTPYIFTVKVLDGNIYINDKPAPLLRLLTGVTYVFDLSDNSNEGRNLRFGKSQNSNQILTNDIIYSKKHSPGNQYSNVTLTLPSDTYNELFYYLDNSSDIILEGNQIAVIPSFTLGDSQESLSLFIALLGFGVMQNLKNNNLSNIQLGVAKMPLIPNNDSSQRPIITNSQDVAQMSFNSKDNVEFESHLESEKLEGTVDLGSHLESEKLEGTVDLESHLESDKLEGTVELESNFVAEKLEGTVDISCASINDQFPVPDPEHTVFDIQGNQVLVNNNSYLQIDTYPTKYMSVSELKSRPDKYDENQRRIRVVGNGPNKKVIEISQQHLDLINANDGGRNFCYVKLYPHFVSPSQYLFIREVYNWGVIPAEHENLSEESVNILEPNNITLQEKVFNKSDLINMMGLNGEEGIMGLSRLNEEDIGMINKSSDNVESFIQKKENYGDWVAPDGHVYSPNLRMAIPIELLSIYQINLFNIGKPEGLEVYKLSQLDPGSTGGLPPFSFQDSVEEMVVQSLPLSETLTLMSSGQLLTPKMSSFKSDANYTTEDDAMFESFLKERAEDEEESFLKEREEDEEESFLKEREEDEEESFLKEREVNILQPIDIKNMAITKDFPEGCISKENSVVKQTMRMGNDILVEMLKMKDIVVEKLKRKDIPVGVFGMKSAADGSKVTDELNILKDLYQVALQQGDSHFRPAYCSQCGDPAYLAKRRAVMDSLHDELTTPEKELLQYLDEHRDDPPTQDEILTFALGLKSTDSDAAGTQPHNLGINVVKMAIEQALVSSGSSLQGDYSIEIGDEGIAYFVEAVEPGLVRWMHMHGYTVTKDSKEYALIEGFKNILKQVNIDLQNRESPIIKLDVFISALKSGVDSYIDISTEFADVLELFKNNILRFNVFHMIDEIVVTALARKEIRSFTSSMHQVAVLLLDPEGISSLEEFKQFIKDRLGDHMSDVFTYLTSSQLYGLEPSNAFAVIKKSLVHAINLTRDNVFKHDLDTTVPLTLREFAFKSADKIFKESLKVAFEKNLPSLPENRSVALISNILSLFKKAGVEIIQKLNIFSNASDNINKPISDIEEAFNSSKNQVIDDQTESLRELLKGRGDYYIREMKLQGKSDEASIDRLVSDLSTSRDNTLRDFMKAVNTKTLPDIKISNLSDQFKAKIRDKLAPRLLDSLTQNEQSDEKKTEVRRIVQETVLDFFPYKSQKARNE